MRLGKTLSELAAEIERQQEVKKDYLVSTPALVAEVLPPEENETRAGVALRFEDQHFAIQDTAHKQIGERLGIPARYYEKMRVDSPELLVENINHWNICFYHFRCECTFGRIHRWRANHCFIIMT